MQTIVNAIFHRRHFWKRVKFNELSELYMSLTLRVLGLSLIGIFIPVYFWQQGFSLENIALFYSAMYFLRLFIDPITGFFVAKYGPKHVIRMSYLFEVMFLLAIIAVGNRALPMWSAIPIMAVAISSFMIPFHADFSNIRSAKKVGRQLSSLTILEKIASSLGPLAGGLLATWLGFEATLIIALIITLLAALPLFIDGEHGSHKTFDYKFSWASYRDLKEDIMVYTGRGLEIPIYSLFWPLFVAITIFSEQVYAGLGLITALGLGATLFSAHIIGKLVDNKKGRALFRFGIGTGSALHLIRPFIASAPAAAAVNVVGESSLSAMNMPLLKGLYYHANHYKHGRVAYVVASIGVMHVARFIAYGLLYMFALYVNPDTALSIVMFICGLSALMMFGEKFKALDE